MMLGERVPADYEERIPPLRIDAAASTEAAVCADPFVGRTLALIRREIARLHSVDDCAALVGGQPPQT